MPSTRLPRFKRSQSVSPIRLTDRDRQILFEIQQHRFLRSNHLTSLLSGSHQQLLRRLQALYHHGYIERPRCQIDYYQSGSRPMVYGIGNKAKSVFKSNWSMRTQEKVGRLFLEHSLMTSDFMVALKLSCRNRNEIRLIEQSELRLPEDSTTAVPFHWRVNVGKTTECGIIPDGAFGLECNDKSGRKSYFWFFLEVDRATMPVIRGNLDKSSFYRKLLAYQATWKEDIHRTRFNWNRFRVITVTSTPQRAQNLLKACKKLKNGRGLFLFTDATSLQSHPDLFSLKLQTTRGATSLLD